MILSKHTVLAVILWAALTYASHSAPCQTEPDVNSVAPDVFNATVFALEYGLPLVAFSKAAQIFVTRLGVNTLRASGMLSTPNNTTVVAPNVDTLYALGVFDLSQNDVLVTIPQVDAGRYYSFAFYDPFGSNFLVLGALHGSSAGDYLLRRAADVDVSWGYSPSSDERYQGYINSPVTDGLLLARVLLKNNSTDLAQAQNLIYSCKMSPVPRATSPGGSVPPLSAATFAGVSSSTPLATLQLTARLMRANSPFNSSDPATVNAKLAAAGLYAGSYHPRAGVNLTAAFALAEADLVAYSRIGIEDLGNGWVLTVPQGMYGDNFVGRALLAETGYLALVPMEALYPHYVNFESMFLTGSDAYLYTFSSRPPTEPIGFWSLTLYNEEGFLVENPINVYAVGDRSNITYPDGTPVYGGEDSGESEGPFQILIQPADVIPPSNWTNNWLPAPSGGGNFSVIFRLYAPTSALTDGSWPYPVVSKVAAIVS